MPVSQTARPTPGAPPPNDRRTHRDPPGRQHRATTDGRYAIRLAGHLDPRWTARFDGMTLTHLDDGTTVLEGDIADQAALHGLLRTLRDLGLPLVSLTRLDGPGSPAPTAPTDTTTWRLT